MTKLLDVVIMQLNKNVPINEQSSYYKIHDQLDHPDVENRIDTFSDYDDDEIHPAHLEKALSDSDWRVRYRAANHKNASFNNLHAALSDPAIEVRVAAMENPNATSDHVLHALSDKNSLVRLTAVNHPNASESNLHRALLDDHEDVRHAAVDRRYALLKK